MQGFVCEVEAGVPAPPTTPPTGPPTTPPSEPCGGTNSEAWVRRPHEGHEAEEDFCYAFFISFYTSATWSQAHHNCTSQGGDLVSIHSEEESTWVEGMVGGLGPDWVGVSGWTGLNRLSTDGQHEWSDGSSADYFHWGEGEPNNAMGQESCVSIGGYGGLWNDEMCSISQGFVCKKPREGTWTTQPSTPFPKGHCPADWMEFEGRCYKFYGGGEFTGSEFVSLNWADASAACRNNSISRMHNGNLASIHSPLQQAFLTAQAARFADEGWTFWIGLNNDLSLDATFKWSDETDVTFTNWASDEPNGAWYDEHCVEMLSSRDRAGRWNDKA